MTNSTIERAVKSFQEIAPDIFDDIDAELIALIKTIEEGPAVTRNHYGRYLSILSQTTSKHYILMACQLYVAGANPQGLEDALRILL